MGKKKQHPTETRDRDEDMKLLARSFFDYLTLLPSKRHEAGVWGIDPKWLLGKSGSGDDALAHEILDVIGYEVEAVCGTCGHQCEGADGVDKKAVEYALDLWSELGVYLEGRWAELHEIEEEHLNNCGEEEENEEEETLVCDFCGDEFGENDDHECEEELEEEDEDEEDGDSCANCGNDLDAFGECDCEPEE